MGYAFTDNLIGYIGSYYFHATGADVVAGPKIRFTYNYQQTHGRILGVLDGVSAEVGAEYDKPRGNAAYIGLKFKVGLTGPESNSSLSGFERHMTELVRRDLDVVVEKVEFIDKQIIPAQDQHEEVKEDKPTFQEPEKVKPLSEWSNEELTEYEEQLTKELALSHHASEKEREQAWHKFALKYHPDKCKGDCARSGPGSSFIKTSQMFEELKLVIRELQNRSKAINIGNNRESSHAKLYSLNHGQTLAIESLPISPVRE